MVEQIVVDTPEAMTALGERLAADLGAGDLLVLTGPLGAGKTTLTRGIGAGLGVRGPVTSPTFVLARTHPNLVGGPPLVHVDAYRLHSAMELDDLDIDFTGSVVVVEWGAGLLDGIADSWLEIEIVRPTGGATDADDGVDDVDDADAAADTDDSDAAAEAALTADEPRAITLRGVGPRWAPTAFA